MDKIVWKLRQLKNVSRSFFQPKIEANINDIPLIKSYNNQKLISYKRKNALFFKNNEKISENLVGIYRIWTK